MEQEPQTARDDRLTLEHTADRYERYLNAVVPPIFMNSLHLYPTFEAYDSVDTERDDQFIYGRVSNPTTAVLEEKLAELEHGVRAAAFSSGMAAFSAAVLATCRAGSHVICMRNVYEPYRLLLERVMVPKYGMSVTYVSGGDLGEIEDAVRENTALLILESPATFVFCAADLRGAAAIAHRRGFRTYIDNTCLTPVFQKPLDYGIDLVMHTMSKYIGGHSDLIGGILIGSDPDLMHTIRRETRELFGAILGPMEAWLAIRGLRTLDVRMREYERIGMAAAQFLEKQDRVKHVYYSGLASHPQAELIRRQQTGHSSLMSFELDADASQAVALIDRLRLFGKGCSWGGYESLALCPLYHKSQEELQFLGAGRGLIRIYCGLEGSDNLIEDLDQALRSL
jgi:cystathionine beta-lyase/cystathionine gamma-synthase